MSLNTNDQANKKVSFESTPNPSTFKFLFHQNLVNQTMEFTSPSEAEISPLAKKIFGFPWTSKVYVGQDFISITKQDWVEWTILAEPLAGLIQEHLESGEKVLLDVDVNAVSSDDQNLDPMSLKIKTLLKNEIQPVVALDGGEIVFHSYKDQVVYIHMRGSCAGCPSSTATLKQGIEVRVKEVFPEVKEVIAI